MMKPTAFIGSSGLKYDVVEAIADRLADEVEVHPWKSAFPVGKATLDSLVAEANLVDFGIFIFGADDRLATDIDVPRDNVVYEAGLFSGILGTERSLIAHEEHVKMPTDLEGMTVARFNGSDNAAEIANAVGPALLNAILEGGAKQFKSFAGTIEGDWWQFSRAPDGGVERSKVSFLRFKRMPSGYVVFTGDAWTTNGDRLSDFGSDLSVVDETSRKFTYRWTGRWYVRKQDIQADPEAFYGRGEIVLSPNNRDRASGHYTTRNDSNRALDDQTPVEYRRAHPRDIQKMDGDDLSARRTLIQERLSERLADGEGMIGS